MHLCIAGAEALVVSLWQVNDYATSKIMNQFYFNLAQDMDKGEQRYAKQNWILLAQSNNILAHPAFWSPFISNGQY